MVPVSCVCEQTAGFHVKSTDCPPGHKLSKLCCKSGHEFQSYYTAQKSGHQYKQVLDMCWHTLLVWVVPCCITLSLTGGSVILMMMCMWMCRCWQQLWVCMTLCVITFTLGGHLNVEKRGYLSLAGLRRSFTMWVECVYLIHQFSYSFLDEVWLQFHLWGRILY